MENIDFFIQKHNLRQNNINKIVDAIKNTSNNSIVEKMSDGATKEIINVFDSKLGKEIYRVSCDGKNVMHFSSRENAENYLK